MVTELQITLLRDALQKILAKASPGNMAFIRCLESQIVKELCGSSLFIIPEWSVFGVTEQCAKDKRFITADQAVELREKKKMQYFFWWILNMQPLEWTEFTVQPEKLAKQNYLRLPMN